MSLCLFGYSSRSWICFNKNYTVLYIENGTDEPPLVGYGMEREREREKHFL